MSDVKDLNNDDQSLKQQQQQQQQQNIDQSTRKRDRESHNKNVTEEDDSNIKRGRTSNEDEDRKVSHIRDKVEDINCNDKQVNSSSNDSKDNDRNNYNDISKTDDKSDVKNSNKPVEQQPKKQSSFAAFASTASPFANTKSNAFSAFANTKPTISNKSPKTTDTLTSDKNNASYEKDVDFSEKLSNTQGDSLEDQGNKNKLDFKPIQQIQTGEEDEVNVFQIRTKLYILQDEPGTSNGNWKERGIGLMKLNKSKRDDKISRLIMRADGVLRVILNIKLYKNMPLEHPQEKFIRFSSPGVDSKLEHYTVKFANGKLAEEAFDTIRKHLPQEEDENKSEKDKHQSQSQDEQPNINSISQKEDENGSDNKKS